MFVSGTMATFDTKSAAQYLHCSPSRVTDLIRCGSLKAAKVGRGYTIKQEWLDAFLDEQTEITERAAVLPIRKETPQPDLSKYLKLL